MPPLPQYAFMAWRLIKHRDNFKGKVGVYKVLVGRPEGKNYWEDLGVGGSIILRWTLGRWGSMG
jgi:hypothetical protein